MTIPGLTGVEVTEFCTLMPEDGYFLDGDVVRWRPKGHIGATLRCRPADGFGFAYDPVTDSFDVTPVLDKPITYTLSFTARTEAAVKEVNSLLTAIARHTTTFTNFKKEVNQ